MRHCTWAYDNAGEYRRIYMKKCKTSNSTFIKLQFVRIRSNNNFKITSIKFHSTKIINKDKDFDILKMNHIQKVLYFLNMQFVPWNIGHGLDLTFMLWWYWIIKILWYSLQWWICRIY